MATISLLAVTLDVFRLLSFRGPVGLYAHAGHLPSHAITRRAASAALLPAGGGCLPTLTYEPACSAVVVVRAFVSSKPLAAYAVGRGAAGVVKLSVRRSRYGSYFA